LKKIVLLGLVIMGLLVSSSTEVYARSLDDIEAETFYYEIQESKEEWQNTNLEKGIMIYDINDNKIGTLYRITDGNIQKGYIVYIDGEGIVEARFEGGDTADKNKNKIYYVFPSRFLTKKEVKEYADKHGTSKRRGSGWGYNVTSLTYNGANQLIDYDFSSRTYYITTSHVPDMDHNVVYDSSTMHFSYRVKDVPDYLNEAVVNGCAPTATSMLIVYYDNELWNDLSTREGTDFWRLFSGWTRFYFPMSAQDNSGTYSSGAVEDLIDDLADDMNTCLGGCNGTFDQEWSFGLSLYMDNHNHGEYDAILSPINDVIWDGSNWVPNTSTVSELSDYQTLIRTGNPAVLMVGAGQYGGGHAVLGIGYYAYSGGGGVIVHDDLNHGESWISTTYVEYFGFIYD